MSLRLVIVLAGALLVWSLIWGPARAGEKPPPKPVPRGDRVIGGEEELPLGSHRIEDGSGRKQRVYTTGGPSERKKESQERAEEERRLILENLPGIIVDTRRPGPDQKE